MHQEKSLLKKKYTNFINYIEKFEKTFGTLEPVETPNLNSIDIKNNEENIIDNSKSNPNDNIDNFSKSLKSSEKNLPSELTELSKISSDNPINLIDSESTEIFNKLQQIINYYSIKNLDNQTNGTNGTNGSNGSNGLETINNFQDDLNNPDNLENLESKNLNELENLSNPIDKAEEDTKDSSKDNSDEKIDDESKDNFKDSLSWDHSRNSEKKFVELNSKKKKIKKTTQNKSLDYLDSLDPNNNIEKLIKLERLYEKKINNPDNISDKKEEIFRDELKKICKNFESNCILESTRGFNIKDEMYYINISILIKNIKIFNDKFVNYDCGIFYKIYKDIEKPDEKIKSWVQISKKGETTVNSKNKCLTVCLKIFEKVNKFRKTINGEKIRAFKNTFYLYKTNIKVDVLGIVKFSPK
jgi:hypothetical protein